MKSVAIATLIASSILVAVIVVVGLATTATATAASSGVAALNGKDETSLQRRLGRGPGRRNLNPRGGILNSRQLYQDRRALNTNAKTLTTDEAALAEENETTDYEAAKAATDYEAAKAAALAEKKAALAAEATDVAKSSSDTVKIATKVGGDDGGDGGADDGASAQFDCFDGYTATKPIDNYQLKTVGVVTPEANQEDVPSPVRVYLNTGGMTVHLFYEGHPDHVTDTNIIDVALYAIGEASGDVGQTATSSADTPPPCGGNGEALPSTLYGVTLMSYNDDNYNGFFKPLDASQCFPRTTNGVVAQAEIVMTESPFDPNLSLAPLIYDNSVNSGATNNGLLQFCARVAYSVGDELVSYIDSKLVLDVSIAADIALFTQEVAISSDQTVNTVNQDVATVIDADSFLCGDPDVNGGTPYAEEYSLGQAFRVCVDVKAADQDKFRLTNFKEVKCSTDAGLERIIISLDEDVATAASVLTSIFDNAATAGAKSVDAENEASSSAISFSTVLTNAYFTGGDETLTCVGSVDVETVAASGAGATPVKDYWERFKAGYEESRKDNWPNMPTRDYHPEINEEYKLFCDAEIDPGCSYCIGLVDNGETLQPCTNDDDGYQTLHVDACCVVPEDELRRQLVSFTVPHPAASRRRMEEETGAVAVAGVADFGATIKLSSSSSSSFAASGPFLLWATTTLVIALVAGWSL